MKKLFKYLIIIIVFLIFHQISYSQPTNDLYTKPIILNQLDNWCSNNSEYTNFNATADGYAGPTCWTSNPAHDVWFEFIAIASTVNISIYGSGTGSGTLLFPRLVLCTITSGTLSYMGNACAEASSGNSGFTSLYFSGLIIGNTYYIRVDGKNQNTGTFMLCINNFTPPPKPGQDCISASYLCNKNTITQVELFGAGIYPDEGKGTCLQITSGVSSEKNSSWYIFRISQSGTLTFTINPDNNADDFDFALFLLPDSTCSNKQLVRCSASQCFIGTNTIGPTGLNMTSTDINEGPNCYSGQNNWVKYVDAQAGENYALLINNWSDHSIGKDNGFTLSFGGTCEFTGPEADFDYLVTSSCLENNSITLTDKSVGAESYHWDFGESATPQTADSKGPFNVNYSTPGLKTIVLTVTGKGGCDVIKTANIDITTAPDIILKDTSICNGQTAEVFVYGFNTYKWSNGSVNNPLIVKPQFTSTYSLTATNSAGCTSTGSVTITVKPSQVVSLKDTSVCQGETAHVYANGFNAYIWSNGSVTNPLVVTPQVSSTYFLTATNSEGCSSTGSVVVNVKPVTVISIIDTSICEGQTAQVFVNGFNVYNWSNGSESNPLIVTPDITSTFSLTATNNYGCKSTASVTISVKPIPVISLNDTSICYGQTAKIFANGFSVYKWSNGSVSNPLIVTPQTTSTYYLTATNHEGCSSSSSVKVTVNKPSFNMSLTSNSPVCEGDTIKLFVPFNDDAIYSWKGPENFSSVFQNPEIINASILHAGKYTVTLKDKNQCTDTANIIVKINPNPTILITPNLINLCFGKSVTLTANGALTYSWSPSNGLSSYSGSSVIANPVTNITYIVTGYDFNGCSNIGYVIIHKDTMHVNLGENDTLCPGSEILLDAGISPAIYRWNNNSDKKELLVNNQGVYSVTVTDENNCISIDTIEIFNYPVLFLKLGKDETINIDTTIILHAGHGFKTYLWQDGSVDSLFVVNKEGIYWVITNDSHGCRYMDSVDIRVTCLSRDVFLPNVFTPENPNSFCDSYFWAEGRCLGNAEISIYNRWGVKVYWNVYDFSNSFDDKVCNDKNHLNIVGNYNNIYYYQLWDGTDKRNGRKVSEGTYFYIFTYNSYDNNFTREFVKKGSVTVLR